MPLEQPYVLKVEEVPPKAIVAKLEGVLNTECAQPLQKELMSISPRAGVVVIDMSAVKFISSTPLGVLVALHKKLKMQGGGKVRLAALPRPIESVIRALCLHQAIELFPTVKEALAAE